MSMPFVVQIVGYKNAGKTTLLCKLLRHLKASGLRVGTVKHDGHDFELDHPGTDTWKHQEAGADAVAITSARQTAWIRKQPSELADLLAGMTDMDVVLVEGFKRANHPKLVMLRGPDDAVLLKETTRILAVVAAQGTVELPEQTANFSRDEDEAIFDFLLGQMG
ncbi:molybdopterin-guanine dinucleotide biosynthesis protein B [Paenibacillus sp. 1P07SE]|uniref:molybdopterin-guanine dinucleotide biosynthesis protein B n=1 Tax=Paenibacillus sp. 1P07SE TaxID=3132209 RepID=UPI0039A4F034